MLDRRFLRFGDQARDHISTHKTSSSKNKSCQPLTNYPFGSSAVDSTGMKRFSFATATLLSVTALLQSYTVRSQDEPIKLRGELVVLDVQVFHKKTSLAVGDLREKTSFSSRTESSSTSATSAAISCRCR